MAKTYINSNLKISLKGDKTKFLYNQFFDEENYSLEVRPVKLPNDAVVIMDLASRTNASGFWEPHSDTSKSAQFNYSRILDESLQLFFVCLENQPVAFFEVLPVERMDLKHQYASWIMITP